MEMSFSTTFWKYALLTLIVFISLSSVILISCGVLALGGAGSASGAYIACFIGFYVMVVSFVGCFAALRESYTLAMTFLGVTIVGIVLQTIFMISFAAMKSEFSEMTARRVANLWDMEQDEPGAMDGVQMQYYCCGKDSPQDYLKDEDDELPKSCCVLFDCTKDRNIYTKGCAMSAVKYFDQQSDDLILATVGAIALEVMGLAAAYFLGKSVEHVVHKSKQIVITQDE